VTNTHDVVEEVCASALSAGAGADGMFERFWFKTTAGAGGLGLGGPPGGVGGQVPFLALIGYIRAAMNLLKPIKGRWFAVGE